MGDMARLAFNDEDGLAVAGFFEADENGVKDRSEGSAYQVFRDSTTKNGKLPFGKSTSEDLARAFGVKKMNTMWMFKKNAIRGTTLEIRKCQFFDDLFHLHLRRLQQHRRHVVGERRFPRVGP